MEIIRGRQTSFIDAAALAERLRGYEGVHIDIGAGDGRYTRHVAEAFPRRFAIGIDACRENLHAASRRAPENALFVIANAVALPAELDGLAAQITINFPWGSLLAGLLAPGSDVLAGLWRVAHAGAVLDVRLNAGALAEAGWPLTEGTAQAQAALAACGFAVMRSTPLEAEALRSLPTTWAKRLAFGRDPRAAHLSAVRCGSNGYEALRAPEENANVDIHAFLTLLRHNHPHLTNHDSEATQ